MLNTQIYDQCELLTNEKHVRRRNVEEEARQMHTTSKAKHIQATSFLTLHDISKKENKFKQGSEIN